MGERTIAVVGAAGLSGTHLLDVLCRMDVRVRAVAHTEEGGKRAAVAGAHEVRFAELADASSIRHALEGADTVYMIPPSLHSKEDELAIAALRAAESVGVERFVYLSVIYPNTPALEHHILKMRVEAEVRDSSLIWTILQPSPYAQVLYAMFCSGGAGPVYTPVDIESRFAALDIRDLAEVAAKVLTQPGYEFGSYELCGPELTVAEMIGIAGRVRGVVMEPVAVSPNHTPIPPMFAEDAYKAAEIRAMWIHYDKHGSRGNSNVLRMLLGHEPSSFESVVSSLTG